MNKNALEVLEKRYLKNGETPDQLFKRVADFIGNSNKERNEFYQVMYNLDFLPNSPTLMNAGKSLGQLSACFVLPIEDSMDGIFETLKNMALIHKTGGGTGFNFSNLREKGSIVNTTKGVASGPISFMKVFDAATNAVKQGGTRRGANMGILNVDHPDILEFIKCKDDLKELNNFNISIGVTDEFIKKIEQGDKKESEIWQSLIFQAWKNGEPGILFLDTINKNTNEWIDSTNPCGEQPLLHYESCNLGSINLLNHVKNKKINFNKLKRTVKTAMKFLNNVIDKNVYPLPEIEKVTKKYRKVGLGVMGFADMLIELEIPYSSEEAVTVGKLIMHFINNTSKIYSQKNEWTTCIAPTGTISIIAGVSSGIEPNFGLVFSKNVMDDTKLINVHPKFEELLKKEGVYSKELLEKVSLSASIQHIQEIPQKIRDIFITSHDLIPKQHIQIQAAFQHHIDAAVSKTVNMQSDATLEDVENAFLLAHTMGCKGVTVYRDGSRQNQVLQIDNKCPNCGAILKITDKCKTCSVCGYGGCSI